MNIIQQAHADDTPMRAISGPQLVADLSKARNRLPPDFKVIADALAYTIVILDHLVERFKEIESE